MTVALETDEIGIGADEGEMAVGRLVQLAGYVLARGLVGIEAC